MPNQDFLIRNGLRVNTSQLVVNTSTSRVGVNTASPAVTLDISANDAMAIPSGNTGQRPSGVNRYFRYNTDSNQFEGFAAGAWGAIGGGTTVATPNGAVQFDNSGVLGGSANLVFDGVSILSVPNIMGILGGTNSLGLLSSNTIGPSVSLTPSLGVILGNSTVAASKFDTSGFWITKQRNQTVTFVALGTTNFDCANGNIMTLSMNSNTAMGSPNNIQPGFYTLIVIQDASGNRNITSWNAVFKWPGGTVPQQTLTANAKDIYSFVCDGTNFYGTFLPDER